MEKQVWIRQKLYDEAKQRCTVLEAENAALKAEVASIRIAQQAAVTSVYNFIIHNFKGIYNESDKNHNKL